ncbi:MAG: serine/threonine-protein phosphatase [Microbacterium sp.]|jgi:serine/threonine protein phosphatase PrpC|uniref:PP2C-family Ser/Thr phosphatase n=4 Tax=Microbacterium ginsengisoli TaxID=400772 RepID=A0A0F0LS62_9MICO|nr:MULTISPECIES: Stp1/IreP family PP2C-type Ser/Thr phosphatase [Microbacterium]MAL06276.1 serine/threonine-protein phosphatase [Microbacterium sp.]MCK9919533.1 Stp1/IreP family PP2C-type Ser/Thr phosphatase [Microbacteriaceae bacterium K1510]KJL35968.1 PP2C-family Ser/Thr phosphatase [Microbacterium ginsengisoli]KQR92100.1 protein phosphatase [Microbacterium sp. Leaf347]KQS05854.1 protein phosphatase [Microbacterium sp. Leaf351]
MVFQGSSTALSHTGKVRSNNQDSGYAGSNLFVVADGMGGHAGGDVASSIAVDRLEELDRPFGSSLDAERALQETIHETATDLIDTVATRPELAGMGTTVSAIVMVDDYAVIAHIGDSRIYLFRDGALTQITTDHTFVQRLVDSGRITPEEARYHPRRSVLMRVLGDMDPDPEVDSFIMPTRPGDRWLLCSDGLSGVVDDTHTAKALAAGHAPARTADMLLKQALDAGAPDNVTIVIVDVGGQHPVFSGTPTIVGSASNPTGVVVTAARPGRSSWLHPVRQAANEPTHFEPQPQFLEELIEEDRRRARRRRISWIVGLVIVIALIAAALAGAYAWTQTRYYVGADNDTVVIYRGIQANIGPIHLSELYQDTGITLDSLAPFDRATVTATISAGSLAEAQSIVERITPQKGSGG